MFEKFFSYFYWKTKILLLLYPQKTPKFLYFYIWNIYLKSWNKFENFCTANKSLSWTLHSQQCYPKISINMVIWEFDKLFKYRYIGNHATNIKSLFSNYAMFVQQFINLYCYLRFRNSNNLAEALIIHILPIIIIEIYKIIQF